MKTLIVALTAALSLTFVAGASAAPRHHLCGYNATGWVVYSNNTTTSCPFAVGVFYATERYEDRHTIDFDSKYSFVMRSPYTGHLFNLICTTAPSPVISEVCRSTSPSRAISVTVELPDDA